MLGSLRPSSCRTFGDAWLLLTVLLSWLPPKGEPCACAASRLLLPLRFWPAAPAADAESSVLPLPLVSGTSVVSSLLQRDSRNSSRLYQLFSCAWLLVLLQDLRSPCSHEMMVGRLSWNSPSSRPSDSLTRCSNLLEQSTAQQEAAHHSAAQHNPAQQRCHGIHHKGLLAANLAAEEHWPAGLPANEHSATPGGLGPHLSSCSLLLLRSVQGPAVCALALLVPLSSPHVT